MPQSPPGPDCPLGTVMSRLYHARRNLARELTTHATDTGDLEALAGRIAARQSWRLPWGMARPAEHGGVRE